MRDQRYVRAATPWRLRPRASAISAASRIARTAAANARHEKPRLMTHGSWLGRPDLHLRTLSQPSEPRRAHTIRFRAPELVGEPRLVHLVVGRGAGGFPRGEPVDGDPVQRPHRVADPAGLLREDRRFLVVIELPPVHRPHVPALLPARVVLG